MERVDSRVTRNVLVTAGAVLLVLATVSVLTHQPWLAAVLAVLGLASLVFGTLESRMEGEVSAGWKGFKLNLVRRVNEKGVEEGLSAAALADAIRKALDAEPAPAVSGGVATSVEEALPGKPTTSRTNPGAILRARLRRWDVEEIADGIVQASAHGASHTSGSAKMEVRRAASAEGESHSDGSATGL